jgi:hypothetical protein
MVISQLLEGEKCYSKLAAHGTQIFLTRNKSVHVFTLTSGSVVCVKDQNAIPSGFLRRKCSV